ncbi:hypothetical protein [Bacillus sp. V2I10]|nr:hypothetical protein [Bacillus sp. V2I10]MDQ0857126.1 hypothetical protein [Bacillus sp. V2I10]
MVRKFRQTVGLLSNMGFLLAGMALLLAGIGQILASLDYILSFFQTPPSL